MTASRASQPEKVGSKLDLKGAAVQAKWWYFDGIELKRCRICFGEWPQHREHCSVAACVQVLRDWRDDDRADVTAIRRDLLTIFGEAD